MAVGHSRALRVLCEERGERFGVGRKQTLRPLDMRTMVDREEFFQFQHGDGRPNLIDVGLRLSIASSPDYMLEDQGATSALVAPSSVSLGRSYCAVTRLDRADCGPDPALLLAWMVNR